MTGITNPTEEYFKDGIWGWDGSQWRKLGISLSYHSQLSQSKTLTVSTGGTNTVSTDTVESSCLWIMQLVCAIDDNTLPTRLTICVNRNSVIYPLFDIIPSGANVWFAELLNFVLVPGDRVDATFFGCNVGDTLYLRVLGYKVGLS